MKNGSKSPRNLKHMSFSLLLMKHDISQNYVQVLKYVDFQTKVIKGSSISQTEWLWILLMNIIRLKQNLQRV